VTIARSQFEVAALAPPGSVVGRLDSAESTHFGYGAPALGSASDWPGDDDLEAGGAPC
jgi:hypothetical protein